MRILIVDDDPGTRGIIRRVLTHDLKCEVAEAPDGRQALAAVDAGDFDALILDIQMPEMGGFEALAALRRSARHAHLPVIMLTADAGEQAVRQAAILGIAAYLTKPVNPARLSPRLKAILEQIARSQDPGATAEAARADLELNPSRPALVADADGEFRTMVSSALAGCVPVIEAENGFKVLQALMVRGNAPAPQVVLMGPQTGLLSGPLLVDKIRKLQLASPPRVVGLYPEAEVEDTARGGVFDAVLPRTADAATLRDLFERLWGAPRGLPDLLKRQPRFRTDLASDVIVATRAQFSVELVPTELSADGPRAAQLEGHVELVSERPPLRLGLGVRTGSDHARALLARTGDRHANTVGDEELATAITALTTSVASRVGQRLSELGLITKAGSVAVAHVPGPAVTNPPPGTALELAFRSESDPDTRLDVTVVEAAASGREHSH